MTYARIYATRWLTQTLGYTVATSRARLQRLLNENQIDRRVSVRAQIEEAIHTYLGFYNDQRIKTTLGGLTINEYRQQQAKPSKNQS